MALSQPVSEVTTDQRLKDRKSTRLNSSHMSISYAVFCLKKKKYNNRWFQDHHSVPLSQLHFQTCHLAFAPLLSVDISRSLPNYLLFCYHPHIPADQDRT